ncbi:MAG TPA: dicarboxylate/amino acid:cation symporter [Candidatus Bathyarchaeia archaeon]|nr:dicarboxylate/amino acid:cation symporter [Candidatus Bathyarchaeia archaeon]
MTKPHQPYVLLLAALSLGLGAASAWPLTGPVALSAMAIHSCVLFAALAVFFLVLPRRMSAPAQIFMGMAAGVATGWAFAATGNGMFITDYVGIFGKLFIDLLKLVIVPLIFFSLICGVAGIGDVRRLGSMGVKTLLYFCCTTAMAVVVGLVFVNLIRPGVGQEALQIAETAVAVEHAPPLGLAIQQKVLPLFLENPVIADQPILAVIFFALLFGAAIAANGDRALPLLRVFQAGDQSMITIIHWIMLLAPMGVFALMANAVATMGIEYLVSLARYTLTVTLGLTAHFCVLVFVVLPTVGRIRPLRFLRGMAPAFQLAFSCSSSSATLPVTLDCASVRVGANRSVCSFVLPLGTTINMDGTALYQAVAAVFIAEVYGMNLGLYQQLTIFLTAIIVSVGTAGIPGASVGLMTIVLASAGIPIEGVGLVLGVDRFLDMSRTLVNVTGDAVGCMVVARSEAAAATAPQPAPDEPLAETPSVPE